MPKSEDFADEKPVMTVAGVLNSPSAARKHFTTLKVRRRGSFYAHLTCRAFRLQFMLSHLPLYGLANAFELYMVCCMEIAPAFNYLA
eukprot:6181094-Pleurochrysis_carterae.AAC.2